MIKSKIEPMDVIDRTPGPEFRTAFRDGHPDVTPLEEKAMAQMLQTTKGYGPNEVALVRSTDIEHQQACLSVSDKSGMDCIMMTERGFVLHGESSAMTAVRNSFAEVMDTGVIGDKAITYIPASKNMDTGRLANMVVGTYEQQSYLQYAQSCGVTEKNGVTFARMHGAELRDIGGALRAMTAAGIENPAIVSANGQSGKVQVFMNGQLPVGKEMLEAHRDTLSGMSKDGAVARFSFDSPNEAAELLNDAGERQQSINHTMSDAELGDDNLANDELIDL